MIIVGFVDILTECCADVAACWCRRAVAASTAALQMSATYQTVRNRGNAYSQRKRKFQLQCLNRFRVLLLLPGSYKLGYRLIIVE